MPEALICDAIRTPFGKYGGALASIRADDLAAIPIQALLERNSRVDWTALDDVVYGCANQAGEDNRNVARMALLLAGLPKEVPGATVNRLCGSSLEALSVAARAIKSGEAALVIAGGVESMSRAPFVLGKAEAAYSRGLELEDTTIGWRFINPRMQAKYGTDSMPQTAENVACEWGISRQDQDRFAFESQRRTAAAARAGRLAEEIVPVKVPAKKGEVVTVSWDEQPRPDTTLEGLSKLKPIVKPDGTITAGNASGVNDGACALLVASDAAAERYQLTPLARIVGCRAAGVAPRVMGMGPVPAVRRLLEDRGLTLEAVDLIELNEAFAAQAVAVLRDLGLPDDAPQVNPNGGAISIGHPLGASGARLVATACYELRRHHLRYAIATMCIGVGQGIAMLLERV
jgi:3-oxoadipyl-CoA thiolase